MSGDTVSPLRPMPGGDRMFDMMAARLRRQILFGLKKGWVNHETDIVNRCSQSDHIKVQLRHVHLPKLADVDYIDWDPDTGAIQEGGRFEEIEPLLNLIDRHPDELPSGWC